MAFHFRRFQLYTENLSMLHDPHLHPLTLQFPLFWLLTIAFEKKSTTIETASIRWSQLHVCKNISFLLQKSFLSCKSHPNSQNVWITFLTKAVNPQDLYKSCILLFFFNVACCTYTNMSVLSNWILTCVTCTYQEHYLLFTRVRSKYCTIHTHTHTFASLYVQ